METRPRGQWKHLHRLRCGWGLGRSLSQAKPRSDFGEKDTLGTLSPHSSLISQSEGMEGGGATQPPTQMFLILSNLSHTFPEVAAQVGAPQVLGEFD